ncbi:MAG: hypothetical protein IAG13_31400 [Deltaproteobacteria bacterium]|nr:hypothetical protein [Nannocystaceae bacterium]
MDLRWLAVVSVIGCGPAVDVGEGGDTDESSSSGGEPSTTVGTTVGTTASTTVGTSATTLTTSVGTDPSTSGPGTVSATDPSATATATDPGSATFTTTASTTDPTGGELPDGETCEEDQQCASGHCFVVGIFGGVCGECVTDSDCAGGGCTPPNPLASPPTPSTCNDGGYGGGCMSDEACADGLRCATVLEVPGVITASTCSECASDAECDAGQLCAPDIAVLGLTGVYRCVEAGTLANGQSCDFATSGDESCASGHCAVADVMGLLSLGVCSACETDAQCMAPQECEPPQVDLEIGLIAGGCV